MISNLVNKCWFIRYPRCKYVIYDNGSEFKLHFEDLCESYGLKREPTSIRNPQANAILERVHQVLMAMVRTSELDMADSVAPNDVDVVLTNASCAIRSTYHTVLKASPGAAIFGRDMLFDVPFIADWKKLSQLCQMSACRFCCPNGNILCRVGDMLRHVAGHVADTRKCRVGRVSKTTRQCRLLPTCRCMLATPLSSNTKKIS